MRNADLSVDVCQLAKRSDADEEERQRNPFT